jgi:hypothetical protein
MRNDRFVPSIYRSSEQLRAFGARAGMLLGLFTGLGLAVWVSIAGAGPLAAILAYSFGATATLFTVVAFVSLRPLVIVRRAAAPLHFHRI